MGFKRLLVLSAVLATASAQAGIYVGSNGVQVGDISVGEHGVYIPNNVGYGVNTTNVSGYGSGAVNDTATYNCTTRNPNASITGTNRTITVKGTCQTITVSGTNNSVTAQQAYKLIESGTNNTITINKVNNISVNGVNSEVEYRAGLTVNKPVVRVSGTNASVNSF